MVAPIDASARLEAGGEVFTLRMNFRALKLAKAEGVNLLSGEEMDSLDVVTALKCFAVADHPDLDDDLALALAMHHSDAVMAAFSELVELFMQGAEGNAKPVAKRGRKKPPAK